MIYNNFSHMCFCGPKICCETELASLAVIFHVKWQPLLQYTVTWETERHFVFLPTIKIKGVVCVQVHRLIRVRLRLNSRKQETLPSYPSVDLQGHSYLTRVKAFISSGTISRSPNEFMISSLSLSMMKQRKKKRNKVSWPYILISYVLYTF